MFERYVAVDNVCAWPNLTRTADGTIIATIFNQPCHGKWEGDLECWVSEDDGRLWHLRGTPAPHEPGTCRMNAAAGLATNGDLIVIASGWGERQPQGGPGTDRRKDACPLPPWVCRSTDGGRTWTHAETMPPPEDRSACIMPFGDIVRLLDGTLGVCIYSWRPPDEHNCYFYSSGDDGRTWTMRGVIQESNINETTPLALPDGRLLAVARTLDDQHLKMFESMDGGTTWGQLGPVTLGFQHPGHLLRLRDGRVLLTYGIRNKGLYGIGARISADEGKTWKTPRVLADFEIATDGGYPSSVEVDDGTIVTAYYCNRIPSHQRYHMGVIRWQR